jgi:hypothetical protein
LKALDTGTSYYMYTWCKLKTKHEFLIYCVLDFDFDFCVPTTCTTAMLCIYFFRTTKEYDLSANENEEQNDENLVKIVDDEKYQLRLQNDWIARSLTSIGN